MSGFLEVKMSGVVQVANPITSTERKRKVREYPSKWEKENKALISDRKKEAYKNNREKFRARGREWYKNNKHKCKESHKKWAQAHPEKMKELCRNWHIKNRDRVRIQEKERANTPKGRLNKRMKTSLSNYLKKGIKSRRCWRDLVGYTVEELKKHLEKQFKDGMNWELLIQGKIHIDHKVPVIAFNFESPEDIDFKRCWALSNLQPMWAVDNRRKHTKIDKPHQPSLLIKC